MIRKKIKKIVCFGIASGIFMNVGVVSALADVNKAYPVKEDKAITIDYKVPSFEEFMKNDVKKKNISEEDMKLLQDIYEKVLEYKKEGKFFEVESLMNDFFKIADKYDDSYGSVYEKNSALENEVYEIPKFEFKYLAFEDFMKYDVKKKDVSKEDEKILESLYNKYVQYEKNGEFVKAQEIMNKFFEVADKYEDLYKNNYNEICVTPEVKVEYATFEEFMKYDIKKKDISKDDKEAIESMYENYLEYSKNGDIEKAEEEIMKCFKIADKYEDIYINNHNEVCIPPEIQTNPLTFEEFMKYDVKKKDVSKDDQSILEKIYKEYIEHKKIGEGKKAQDDMKKFFEIVNRYEDR